MKLIVFIIFFITVKTTYAQSVINYNERVKRLIFLGDLGVQSSVIFYPNDNKFFSVDAVSCYAGIGMCLPIFRYGKSEFGLQVLFYRSYYYNNIKSTSLINKEFVSYLYYTYKKQADYSRSFYLGIKGRQFDYISSPAVAFSYHKNLRDNFFKYNLNFMCLKMHDPIKFRKNEKTSVYIELGVSYIFQLYSLKTKKWND